MLKCEYCGKEYDPEEAEEYFNDEMAILVYSNVRKRLCGECAVQAIYDDEEGVYIQKCEECGREFDYVVDKWEFENDPSTDGLSLIDCWEGVKCAQCAIEAHKKRLAEYDDYEDTDDREGYISVYEAADIWLSNGKDEDYMFGYTEEELEEALGE